MEQEYARRERLIACAKREFLEKGFAKASLRNISKEAGLTTGAVYFFCKDKNGLFGAVVEEPLQRIAAAISQHFAEDLEEDLTQFRHTEGDHDAFAELMIDLLYADRDAMMILLQKATGSAYEDIVDRFIGMVEQHGLALANHFSAAVPGKRVNPYMLHWLSHVQVNAFVHLLTHEPDPAAARKAIKPVMDVLIESWMGHILEDDA